MRAGVVVIGLVAALSGCGVSSHTVEEPVPLARFCGLLFDALCGPLEACACGEAAVSACRAEQRELCAGFPAPMLVRAVEEGRVRYDADAAARLVERLGARAQACASFADAVGWQVRDLFHVGGVFEGTSPAGASCEVLGFELISECALGSCTPTETGRVCRTVVGPGEACDALHHCADLDAPLDPELGIERLSLPCVDGTCVARVELGGACRSGDQCVRGRCEDGRCVAAELGQGCLSSRECASGHCEGGRCAPGDGSVGAECHAASACASGVCVAGECLPAFCATF